jgi:hypothetical protein
MTGEVEGKALVIDVISWRRGPEMCRSPDGQITRKIERTL